MSSIIPLPSPTTNSPSTSATPTPTPTPTTDTTASATTSSPSTSAPTSATSQTSSTPPSTSTPPTTTQSTTSSSGSLVTSSVSTPASLTVISSGGGLQTVTAYYTPTVTSAPPTSTPGASNSFFSNTGAVAGVFTVVGLIVVALVVALVTNAIRRRRAQKFDRDVAEAAAEAAASSRSPFDDYSYPGGGGGGYGYSDNSHGTFQQPPMLPHNESYGMSEMSQYDPYAAGATALAGAAVGGMGRGRKDSEPGVPGIAGVGAGTLAREPSKRNPYLAFAGPGPQPHEMQDAPGSMRYRRGQDVLEAAGLGGPGAAAVGVNNANNGGAFINRRPSEYTQNTHNSGRSQGYGSSNDTHPAIFQPGYHGDPHSPPKDTRSADPFAGYTSAPYTPSSGLPNPHHAPSPSPPGQQSDEGYDSGSPTALRDEEQRMSYQDDADYSQSNRVLRVANE
ncbi:hypothetical protein BU15DRAFT_78128 [Melanogaster broomeanus]|nr:hypothetical protein BU15DRAFT_78128 [Melanogaster broomeanus]